MPSRKKDASRVPTDVRLDRLFKKLLDIEGQVNDILHIVRTSLAAEVSIMATIDDILNEVGELDDINDSLDLLFVKLQELIQAGGTDPAKLQEALNIITTQKARTKAAIVQNTPAAPPPTP